MDSEWFILDKINNIHRFSLRKSQIYQKVSTKKSMNLNNPGYHCSQSRTTKPHNCPQTLWWYRETSGISLPRRIYAAVVQPTPNTLRERFIRNRSRLVAVTGVTVHFSLYLTAHYLYPLWDLLFGPFWRGIFTFLLLKSWVLNIFEWFLIFWKAEMLLFPTVPKLYAND